jgi:hypothetical protein
MNPDMPVSSCQAGKSRHDTLAACNPRKHAKATLAHSAVALYPDVVIDAEDDDRLAFEEIFGELETRVRERGCSGDCGREVDRRRVLRVVDFRASLEEAGRRSGAGALIASLRAFVVELMTSVAKIAFSRGDSCFSTSTSSCVFAVRDPALDGAFALALAVVFAFVALDVVVAVSAAGLGRSKSERIVAVAGMHVVVDFTALLTTSALSCKEAIVSVNKQSQQADCLNSIETFYSRNSQRIRDRRSQK